MAHYSTFVIRILVDDERNGMLEGQITQASTHETVYFRDLSKAVDFIRRNLGDEAGPTSLPRSAVPHQPASGELEDVESA